MTKGSYSIRDDCESNPPRRRDSSFHSFICALLVFLGIIILVSLFIMLSSWNANKEQPSEKEHLSKEKDVEILNDNKNSNQTKDRLVIVSVPVEFTTTVDKKFDPTTTGSLFSNTEATTESRQEMFTQTDEKEKYTSTTQPKTTVILKTHVPTTTSPLFPSTSPSTTTNLIITREVELSTIEVEQENNEQTNTTTEAQTTVSVKTHVATTTSPLVPSTASLSNEGTTTREITLSIQETEQGGLTDEIIKGEYTTAQAKTTVETIVDLKGQGVESFEPETTTTESDYFTSSTSSTNKNYEDEIFSLSSEYYKSGSTTADEETITSTRLKDQPQTTDSPQSDETTTITETEEDVNTFSTLDWLERYSPTTKKDVRIPEGVSDTTSEQLTDLTTHKLEQQMLTTQIIDLLGSYTNSTEKEVVIVDASSTILQSSSTERYLETEKVSISTTISSIQTRARNDGLSPIVTSDTDIKNFEQLCTSSACKSTASRMLGMMNHSSDPCEDFYEFACGGAYHVAEESAESTDADMLSTHLNAVHNSSEKYLRNYKNFYESCLEHDLSFRYGERMQKVRDLVEIVGRFEAEGDSADYDITDLFSKLILRQSMPLFDIGLDVDKQSSNYILQLTLPDESSLKIGLEGWSALFSQRRQCLKRQKTQGQYLDLTKTYESLLDCQRNYASYLKSIEDVVRELKVFPSLNSTGLLKEIKDIRFTIEFEFLDQFSELPPPAAIRKAFTKKEYDVRKVSDLQAQYPIVQWKRLFQTLTGHEIQDNALVQVYLGGYFRQMFQKLASVDLRKLKNALLAIYANDLFHNTVIPRETSESYCLDLTQKLMPDITSYIVQQDYAKDEQNYHHNLANDLFKILKEKFAKSLLEAEWLDDNSRIKFLDKSHKLSLVLFQGPNKHNLGLIYSNLTVTNNFQENLVNLMVFSRHLKYSLEGTHISEENIFSYFLNPLDRRPLTFYSNGIIAVPIGLLRQASGTLPGYVTMARVGFHLAKAMTTHFTPTGMKYGIVLSENSSPTYSELISTTDMMMEHSNSGHMIFVHQNISFQLNGSLFSNEMIADNAAFRLVTDNFNMYGNVQVLPWITSSYSREKTFFIAVAQEYCRRTSVLDFMVQVFESDHLPPRLLVANLMGHSETFSDKLFECAGGSDMNFDQKLQFPFMQKVEDYSNNDDDLYRN